MKDKRAGQSAYLDEFSAGGKIILIQHRIIVCRPR
jgi:hypothetical protein